MRYLTTIKLCEGTPTQFGECEKCGKKVASQVYKIIVKKEHDFINQITNKMCLSLQSDSFGHLECMQEIEAKYKSLNNELSEV